MRRAIGAAALTTFIVLFAPILAGWYYHGLDLTRVDLGLLCAIRDQLATHQGLWLTPYLGGVSPLFGRPDALLLYPPRWPALLLTEDLGTAWGVVFHLTVASAGATALCGTFRVRPPVALLSGLSFVMSGTVLDLILHANYIVAAAWLPLVWAMSRRFMHPRGRPRHLALTIAALTLLLLGGEPQAFGIGAGLVLFEAGATWLTRGCRASRRVGILIGGVLAAFAIALVQWLPILAEAALTPRRAALDPARAFYWSFTSATWPAVLWPGFLTEPAWPLTNLWAIMNGDAGMRFPWNREPYLGALFVAAIVCSLSLRRSRRPAVVAGVGLVCALGDITPIFPTLAKLLPLVTLFRYPAKYLTVTVLAAVVLLSIFLDTLPRRRALRRSFVWAGGTLLAFQAATLIAVLAAARTLDIMALAMPSPLAVADLPHLSSLLSRMVMQTAAPLALALVSVALVPKLRPWIGAFVVADLLFAAPAVLNLGPSLVDLTSPLAASLPRDPPSVLCVDPHLRSTAFQRPDVYSRWGEIVDSRTLPDSEVNACDRLRSAVPYSPLQTSAGLRLEEGLVRHRAAAARALGCTHLVSDRPPVEGTVTPLVTDAGWLGAYERLIGGRVYVIDDPLPEAFVVRNPHQVDGDGPLIVAIGATRSAAQAMSVVDEPLGGGSPATALPSGTSITLERVERPASDTILVSLAGEGGAVIGLKTAFLVGWQATQTERPLKTLRIAGQQLGVIVDDAAWGPVELHYTPPRLGLGACLTGLGLALALILSVVARGPTRARRSVSQTSDRASPETRGWPRPH